MWVCAWCLGSFQGLGMSMCVVFGVLCGCGVVWRCMCACVRACMRDTHAHTNTRTCVHARTHVSACVGVRFSVSVHAHVHDRWSLAIVVRRVVMCVLARVSLCFCTCELARVSILVWMCTGT